jgi:hypothetical protein
VKKASLLFLLIIAPLFSNAQSVDILWQGDGYVSPFYRGHTQWGRQTEITFIAIPQGLGDPATLEYTWIRDSTVLGLVSGVGKNTLSFVDTVFSKPVSIGVEITKNEAILAQSSVTVSPVPQILPVYENHPLFGYLFHHEVGSEYIMEGEEVTFTAFPFFFNTPVRDITPLTYKWNGRTGASAITYRSPENNPGLSAIEVDLSSSSSFMQTASRNFLVQFGTNDN